MFITIWAGGMPFNGDTIPSGASLGGSESAAYYTARALAKRGHRVTVFTSHKQGGTWDGVTYEFLGNHSPETPLGDRFHFYTKAPTDVVIIQRHPVAFQRPPSAKLSAFWFHDLALVRYTGQVTAGLVNVDLMFTVSEFHRQQVARVYGVDDKHIVATTNGVDYELGEKVWNGKKNLPRQPRSLFYMARPERGLENLVAPGGIMEMLPDCHLYVCGYDNTVASMRAYYEWLWKRCDELPNVTNLGPLGKKELYEHLVTKALYVYPTEFEDTSCIAAMEAQMMGTPFISSKIAALPETLKDGGAVLLKLGKDGKVDKKRFADTVRAVLADERQWTALHEKGLKARHSWDDVAEQWETEFDRRLAEKCSDPRRLYTHLEQMSDIVAASEYEKISGVPMPEKMRRRYSFLFDNTFAEHYQKVYEYERDRGVVYGPESLDGNGRFEMVDKVLRGIESDSEYKALRVLDYGCAHGHYTMNLWRRHPDWQFTGVDIAELNIKAANRWKEQEKADNVVFRYGTAYDALAVDEEFDVIMVNEVLEHVADPRELVSDLMGFVARGGYLVGTVPYGPWEAIGYDKHELRAHIHHFERSDLKELFGDQDAYKIIAIPHGEGLGHYVFLFRPLPPDAESFKDLGRIDYARKLKQQAPRETVSACIIAKDAGNTLARTLERVAPLVDEVIVGVDMTSTDDTMDVARRYGEAFAIPSPAEIGFDEARNLTIDKATCDWIFWIDSDELLEYGERMHRYLRPNAFDGYAIQQHHMSVDPLGVQKTDLPVRLFRNHKGIRFYGVVHEHPSIDNDPNKGVGKVAVMDGVSIMHVGYSTEAVRRRRFERNFPLMRRDREKYPDRILGKFLWMRDLAHLITYRAEVNGGRVEPQMTGWALEAIEIWRWLVQNGHGRMATEGLQYYSRAVAALGNGIEYAINLGVSARNGGAKLDKDPYMGLFATTDDIKLMTDMLVDDRVKVFDEQYF